MVITCRWAPALDRKVADDAAHPGRDQGHRGERDRPGEQATARPLREETGVQALVRLPLIRRRLDLKAGLNTAGFAGHTNWRLPDEPGAAAPLISAVTKPL